VVHEQATENRGKMIYYNEFNPDAAAWLRELIKLKLIADGEVDERSIIDVQAGDLSGFTQHHFFAGIGGWSYALRLAGWADDRPVCTASLPCQPFSVAGLQKGVNDERHLLPHFIELVKQCNFQTIFGEQVPGAIKHGWLDDLCTEVEREKYRVGQIVLTAAGEGAPHIRQRLYWVADSINTGSQGRLSGWQDQEREIVSGHVGCSGTVDGMGNNTSERLEGGARQSIQGSVDGLTSTSGRMGNTEHDGQPTSEIRRSTSQSETESGVLQSEGSDTTQRLGNTEHDGQPTSSQSRSDAASFRHIKTWTNSTSESEGTSPSRTISEWTDPDWLYCRDEKYRPIKSSIEPLANGLSRGVVRSGDNSEAIDANNTQEARVMRLKGYGNAIVPQVASSFIQAFMAAQ
jgi:DNA (cytosine-5)-methyltransferase 1